MKSLSWEQQRRGGLQVRKDPLWASEPRSGVGMGLCGPLLTHSLISQDLAQSSRPCPRLGSAWAFLHVCLQMSHQASLRFCLHTNR